MDSQKKNLYTFAFVIILIANFAIGCATVSGRQENLKFSIPTQPLFVKEVKEAGLYVQRFVIEGESIDQWTEAVEILNFLKKNLPQNPELMYASLKEKREKCCPDTVTNIIEKDESSILYEMKTSNCPPNPDEHSITKILYGKINVFTLIYTAKVKELDAAKRDLCLNDLSSAYISQEK
jgi:hypothetical protein